MATNFVDQVYLTALEAGADLSAKVSFFANVNSSGQAILGADTGRVIGVITEGAASGGYATIQYGGVAKVKAGSGGLTAGDNVMSDASGQGITATGAGAHVAGVCLVGAAAGGFAEVLLQQNRLHS